MSRLRARLAQEGGWAVLTAVLVLGILLSLSLPLLSLVDQQQSGSAHERKGESSFNLAEAAFDASVFVLANGWPVLEENAYPATCSPASATTRCPDASTLNQTYTGPDYPDRDWSIQIRDDTAGSDYYDPAVVPSQPTWDSNGNAKMWVRADAHGSGNDRTIVALVKRQDKLEPFPRNAVTAGWFRVNTGGSKVIVDTKGKAAQAKPVAVRCTEPAPSVGCLEYYPDRDQVSPDTAYSGYSGDTAIPPDALARMRDRAQALGTYYASGCPASAAGELVFVENGNCAYAGGGTINGEGMPGMLIVANGSLSLSGSVSFYGLVYAANLQNTSAPVVTIAGAASVVGAIAADGQGGVAVGSNGRNIIYDEAVFPLIKSFGGAVAVQGTWRELPAS